MVFEALSFDTTRNLGINYIPCCKIVLMFYNGIRLCTRNFNDLKNTKQNESRTLYRKQLPFKGWIRS